MEVLNLCSNDYANFMFDMTEAMKTAGIDVVAVKKHPHEFGYEKEIPVGSHLEIRQLILQANTVQIFHSDLSLYNLTISLNPRARRIIYHTGTLYRQNPDKYNKAIDPQTKIVHALGEFMKLGAKDPSYIVGAMDTNKILPRDGFIQKREVKKLFGHFPSSKINKGTALIERLMESHTDINYITSGTLLPHQDHLKRIQEVDILIELFSPTQGGKIYGSWGMTTLEAAAMAKIVITQNLNDRVYQEHYGDHPLLLAHNPQEFHDIIKKLQEMNVQEIIDLQIKTWKWVHHTHGYVSTGRYIKNNILNS